MSANIQQRLSSPKRILISNGFRGVKPNRPCRICSKTDFCGYAVDGRTSICMRVSEGARRMSQNGGYVHVHTDVPFAAITIATPQPAKPKIELASIEVRDAVYQELIRVSPATKYFDGLISGPDGLAARGLGPNEFGNYGALPPTRDERARLAYYLRCFVVKRFPDYKRGIIGIPGFWVNGDNRSQIWKPRDYHMPMLVIPYRDSEGRIQACQLRMHQSDIPEGQKRYSWLASPRERYGCSSGTPIHFTFRPKDLAPGSKVVMTEGGLKADVFVHFRKSFTIATSGVSCSHEELVKASAPYHLLIAFDADHKTNPNVCRQLARLIAARELHKDSPGLTTRVVHWQEHKGIDDAAKANVAFTSLSIAEWFDTLTDKALSEVKAAWHDLNYAPTPTAQ